MNMKEEMILEIRVRCLEALTVKGHSLDVCMIPFTGRCDGPYFTGSVLGAGVDTQKIPHGGAARLSARYLLEGTDYTGAPCRIFIENQTDDAGALRPMIVTDSDALAPWEQSALRSTVDPAPGGVTVRIYTIAP